MTIYSENYNKKLDARMVESIEDMVYDILPEDVEVDFTEDQDDLKAIVKLIRGIADSKWQNIIDEWEALQEQGRGD